MLLNRGEREKLRDLEKSLPQGRYYAPSEILSVFRLDIPKDQRTKTVEEIASMDELWIQFNKEIWKAKKMVKLRFDKAKATAIPTDPTTGEMLIRPGQIIPQETTQGSGPIDDDEAAFGSFINMDPEERYNWGEYVLANYRRPRNSASSLDAAFGMAD